MSLSIVEAECGPIYGDSESGTFTYTTTDRAALIEYCNSWDSDCEPMVTDATKVGTPRTCSPLRIREWIEAIGMYGYRGDLVSLSIVEAECGPIY